MPETNIYSLGFDNALTKPSLFSDTVQSSNAFSNGAAANSLTSGELTGNLVMVDGYMQSGNFVTGSAGWKIDKDGNVEFCTGTFRGTLAAVSGTFGSLIVGDSGNIALGKTAYTDDTHAGFWLGDVSGTGKFNIGSSSTKYFHYDGTDLSIMGGTISGGNIYASSGSSSGNVHLYVGTYGGQCDVEYGGVQKGFFAASDTNTIIGAKQNFVISSTADINEYASGDVFMTFGKSSGSGTVFQVYHDSTMVMEVNNSSDVWVRDTLSAGTLVDRTPHYDGDAIQELRQIKGKKDDQKNDVIDHDTLPSFMRKDFRHPKEVNLDTKEVVKQPFIEPGRNLGAAVSMLIKAVVELDDKIENISKK